MALPRSGAHPDGAVDMPPPPVKWREVISNARDRAIEGGMEGVVEVDCTAGGTIALTVDQQYAHQLVRLTGTPGAPFTIEMLDGDRNVTFENVAGQTATIDTAQTLTRLSLWV